ncbi:MAG: molybdenum cofactor guanylyltransferase [Promethearchaeota archaeon]
MENPKYLAILILIGGKSTRFGIEKAVIDVLGKPLILHQIETLAKFDQDIFLVAHSGEQVFKYQKKIKFPKEVHFIVDDREIINNSKTFSPILGIYSGFKELNKLGFEKAFLLSCDMPLIKAEVIEYMIKESVGYDCCIPRWKNGFLEPFFAIYPVNKGFNRIKEILKREDYGLLDLLDESWKIKYILVEETIQPLDENLTTLINIKGPIDIAKLMKYF